MGRIVQFDRDKAAMIEALDALKVHIMTLEPTKINAIFFYCSETSPKEKGVDLNTFQHGGLSWGDIARVEAYMRLMADSELNDELGEGGHPLDPDLGPVA